MTKTLAQMTGKEREECMGMWCDCGSRLRPAVLSYANHRQGYFISPASGTGFVEVLTRVTPRHDLPRAWKPDGTPPDGEWLAHGTHTRVIPKNRRAYVTMSEPEPSQ